MDKTERKFVRKNKRDGTQAVKIPEFVPLGLPSPPKGAVKPCSVSPTGDNSLHAFAAINGEGIESTGSVSLRLAEFIGKKNRRRRKGKGSRLPRKTGNRSDEDFVVSSDKELDEAGLEPLKLEDTEREQSPERLESTNESESPEGLESTGTSEPDNVGTSQPDNLEKILLRMLAEQLNDLDTTCSPVLEEELSQNKQEQDDEILVLEAIYEGSFRYLEPICDDHRSFLVEVSVEIEEPLQICIELESASTSQTASTRSFYDFTLEYLPPLILACVFPNTYPSRSPPVVVLQSQWLPTRKLVQLSQQLDHIWESQKGEVVVYAWTEFLQSQSLSFLDASKRLILESSSQHIVHNVISECSSPENDAVSLLHYNEELQQKTFLTSFHTCNICFTEFSGKDFVKLPCQHSYCRSCMQQLSSVHVTEGSVNRLRCPDVACAGSIPPFILKELLGEEAFQRWERLCLQKTLDSMSDIVYCPRCAIACIEDSDHHAQCGHCFFNFCSLCRAAWHVGQECLSATARLAILQAREKGQLTEEQRQKEANLVNELKNLDEVRRNSKPCPQCGMAIAKSEGCNKMTCSNCGSYFCFKCGKKIKGYDHFGGASCALLDVEEIQRWQRDEHQQLWQLIQQEAVNNQFVRAQQQVMMFPERVRVCPSCGQRNAKVGNNNHIFCTACQNHYCGVCHKIVRKASEHYGPNKCKQHTADAR